MCRYSIVYCITVIPISVARWIGFAQEARYGANFVPAAATFAVGAIFFLSGFLNVVLFLTTRLELFDREDSEEPEAIPLS